MTRKTIGIFVAFCLALPLSQGCDFFRKVAGRPTSADISAKRELIAEREAARADSLAAAARRTADSLALVDSLRNLSSPIVASRPVAGQDLPLPFYVIVGSFGKEANARAFAEKTAAAGYPATLIPYKNGFTAVGVCPSADLPSAYEALKKVRKEPFCPSGVWILNNE